MIKDVSRAMRTLAATRSLLNVPARGTLRSSKRRRWRWNGLGKTSRGRAVAELRRVINLTSAPCAALKSHRFFDWTFQDCFGHRASGRGQGFALYFLSSHFRPARPQTSFGVDVALLDYKRSSLINAFPACRSSCRVCVASRCRPPSVPTMGNGLRCMSTFVAKPDCPNSDTGRGSPVPRISRNRSERVDLAWFPRASRFTPHSRMTPLGSQGCTPNSRLNKPIARLRTVMQSRCRALNL